MSDETRSELAEALADLRCGDNSCVWGVSPGGMHTNGGCRCFREWKKQRAARVIHAALAAYARFVARVLEKPDEEPDDAK